jgi:hypothetical protein
MSSRFRSASPGDWPLQSVRASLLKNLSCFNLWQWFLHVVSVVVDYFELVLGRLMREEFSVLEKVEVIRRVQVGKVANFSY